MYPLCGLQLTSTKYFNFMFLQILGALSATSLSNCCSCICVSIELSTVVLACIMEITRLYSGFFVSPLLQLNYPRWKTFTVISYMKYMYVGLCLNEWQDLKLYCHSVAPEQRKKDAAGRWYCPTTSGNKVIPTYGYDLFDLHWCKLSRQ